MNVVIVGGAGQVAFELQRLINPTKYFVTVFDKAQLDITDWAAVAQKIGLLSPDILINVAAYTQVDKAEDNVELAYAVNAEGAKNLAMICEKTSAVLLHLSTDYVFDGAKTSSYSETDIPSPINVYGKSKLLGEESIQMACRRYLIVRVSSVFGVHGSNFVKTILRLAKEKEQLQIVFDQVSCPTPAKSIAEVLWQLCDKVGQAAWGVYHYCGMPAISWYDFAQQIVAQVPASQLKTKHIAAICATEYLARANRPAYSVLDCSRIANTFGIIQPDWQKELKNVINELSAH